jgi:PEP-CTERM motif
MRLLRYLFVLVLVCSFTSLAKADSVDFHMGVLDPSGLHPTPIYSSTFSVDFSTCPKSLSEYEGCFVGINDTDKTFTTLSMNFPNNSALNGQAATCDTTLSGSIFSDASCTYSNGVYTLDFFDGKGIDPCETFVIVETGVDPSDFPRGTATLGQTPEPGTGLLFSTGLSMLGFVAARRRGFAERITKIARSSCS